MASATSSSRRPDAPERLPDSAAFDEKLRPFAARGGVPLLVLRLAENKTDPASVRRHRLLERRCRQAFVESASRVLRADDLLGYHPPGEFLAALVTPTRSSKMAAGVEDCRAALARLAAALESATTVAIESGWTIVRPEDRLGFAIERALIAGRHERERYELVSALKHELRTPLTSIRGYLETVIDGDLDAQTGLRFLETARGEALRMERLIDGLFDRSAFGLRPPAADASGELSVAIAAAFDAVAPLASSRGVTLFQVDPAPYRVRLETDQITQVLVNLLENAVKHGRENGRVFVSILPLEDGQMSVWVDDDGPGILKRDRERIFAFATRGSRAKAQGSGLGLALVRLLLECAGGSIALGESVLGGARFGITLPSGS